MKKNKRLRMKALAMGPIGTRVKGSKKGKRGYNRKVKDWKKDDNL
jgi:hypothetical protein